MRAMPAVTLVLLALAGCGGDEQGGSSSAPQTGQQTTQTEQQTTQSTATGQADADPRAALRDCFQKAGAKLADSGLDLRFAAGSALGADVETDIASVRGDLAVSSFKPSGSGNWRIYFAVPEGGDAPGFTDILRNPRDAAVVAYVNPGDPEIIAKADACTSE
jgi:hypothetical protein